jgi:hypothetical protein
MWSEPTHERNGMNDHDNGHTRITIPHGYADVV